MIGSGLKKMANKYRMNVGGGKAQGYIDGYMCTLDEGMGFKRLVLDIQCISNAETYQMIEWFQNEANINQFKIDKCVIYPHKTIIKFYDTHGTLDRMYEFFHQFFPILKSLNAVNSEATAFSGHKTSEMPLWEYDSSKTIFEYEHEQIQKMGMFSYLRQPVEQSKYDNESLPQESTYTTYSTTESSTHQDYNIYESTSNKHYDLPEVETTSCFPGVIGAIAGALLLSAFWIYLWRVGWISSFIVIYMINAAIMGYHLLKGKEGKSQTISIIVAVAMGIVTACVLRETLKWSAAAYGGQIPQWAYRSILRSMVNYLKNPKFLLEVLKNIGIGTTIALPYGFYFIRRLKNKKKNA